MDMYPGQYVYGFPFGLHNTCMASHLDCTIDKMAKNHFLRSDFGSWGGFLGVLGASLYWKVVLEFWFGHPKCQFWYPQNGQNTPFYPFWGYQKWHFGCPNQSSKTTFQYKLAPKTAKKPPQEPKSDIEKWFLAILSILHIFTPFSH